MPDDTKSKLIESATGIFAKYGYKYATVASIASLAKVNIAAVNYHFQSKENLFVEVLRHSFKIANGKYPVSGGLSNDEPPLERVKAFSQAILRRSFDAGPAGDFNRIMCKTVSSPEIPIQRIMQEVQVLELVTLDKALLDLLTQFPEPIYELAKINIIHLSSMISQLPFLPERLLNDMNSEEDVEQFIELQSEVVLSSLTPLFSLNK